jgi:hypothetical protein
MGRPDSAQRKAEKEHCGRLESPVYFCVGMRTIPWGSHFRLAELHSMTSKRDSMPYDEEAAIEAAQESSAVPPLREVLKREYGERLKGRPRDEALEKWGAEIEEVLMRELHKLDG